MIENRQLRYFIAAARALHITKAAESLHIAQPALTKNIHQLEEELGVQLFRRVKRRVALSEAGAAFLVEAERTLQQLEFSVSTAKKSARGEAGKLAIGFVSTAGLMFVPKLVAAFRKKYPDVAIDLFELRAEDQMEALRKGTIDVGFLYGPCLETEFSVRQLASDRFVVAIPKGHRLSREITVDLRDIGDEYFILPNHGMAGAMVDAALEECRRAGFQPRTGHAINTSTVQTTLGLVSAGLGVSVMPSAVSAFVPGVVFRPIRNAKIKVRMNVLWRTQNSSPVLQNLLDSLGAVKRRKK